MMLLPSDIQKRVEAEQCVDQLFRDVVQCAFIVYNEYHAGLLESAYEAALTHVLTHKGYKVESQVELPMFFRGERLNKTYRMDLVVEGNMILELKALHFVGDEQRRQLWNYMRLTHTPYGMLVNFGDKGVFSQKYYYDASDNECYEIM